MGKPDEQIKIVMRRGDNSIALVDFWREGNDYHATLSGSHTKRTYHSRGQIHITEEKKGEKKRYRDVKFSVPPEKIKGFVQLIKLSIPPASEWHSGKRYFKRYHGSGVTMLEIIDVENLEEDENIVIVAGLVESKGHATRKAVKIRSKNKLNRPVIKKILSREGGPTMAVFIYFVKRHENQTNSIAISFMGSEAKVQSINGALGPRPKTHFLVRDPGTLLFPIDHGMSKQIRTIWKEEHKAKDDEAFDFVIRNVRTANYTPYFAVVALLPKKLEHLVTYDHIALHINSRGKVPLPVNGEVLGIDLPNGMRTRQEFCVNGQFYRLTLLQKYSRPPKSPDNRTYFVLEFTKLTPHFWYHYNNALVKQLANPISINKQQSQDCLTQPSFAECRVGVYAAKQGIDFDSFNHKLT